MRNTFINKLCDLAYLNKDIFLICGDLGYSVLEPFKEAFPDRYLNAGIAEQNMTQVAVGLAKEGYNVFTYSIGNFPTLRCMEQIRYDVCYHEANVKIIAVGSGYAYGPQGVSHHTTEDIAMLRSIPNMLVCAPGDPIEAKAAATFMAKYNGPGYVRLNKTGEQSVHMSDIKISPGNFMEVINGKDVAVISTGALLYQNWNEIKKFKLSWGLYSSPFVGNYAIDGLIKLANKYNALITIEEHQLNGGFGSSIIEALSDLYASGLLESMPKITRIGISNKFIGYAGTQEFLREAAKITLSDYTLM